MFKLVPANKFMEQILLRPDDLENDVREELTLYINKLEMSGEVCGANFVRMAQFSENSLSVATEPSYQIPCRNVNLVYIVDKKKQLIYLYGFEVDPVKKIREIQDSLNSYWEDEDEDLNWYVPQADRPDKLLRALELINEGYCTALELAIKLNHKGKKDRDKARHGSYFGRALVELGLAKRHRNGSHSYIYELTDKGREIASCSDRWARLRLLAQAMLGFYPVEAIFHEVTLSKQPLTLDLIMELVDQLLSPGNHKEKTLKRRAECLMRWVIWVSSVEGIFIHRPVENELQLRLPFLEDWV